MSSIACISFTRSLSLYFFLFFLPSGEHLLWVVSDLFSGGMETTTNSILWTLVYLMHYPEVLNKCYRQITSVVGTDRPPSILDRPSLPYVEATIMEVSRLTGGMSQVGGNGYHPKKDN